MPRAHRIGERNLIQRLPNGAVLVDHGPMRLSVYVSEKGKVLASLAEEGGLLALELLQELARFLPLLKRRSVELDEEGPYPEIVKRMIRATKEMGEPDLTPLAAVAGTISEMVADFIFHQGGTRVIVENGGDIALRMREGEVVKVGIRSEIETPRPSFLVTVDSSMEVGGVATSGLGGRSFTKGIASAATVFARKASSADAAATVVGNFTNLDAPEIARALAESLYPDTDIAGQWVTTRVGMLLSHQVEQALKNGLSKASELRRKGLIQGAFIAVQGKTLWTDSLSGRLAPL
ncbi:MAG: UPF0280 family protein [Desulfobacterota bacterium]|nr:UPF0280 family protein [Thermodesulfobacteriota bacterium]